MTAKAYRKIISPVDTSDTEVDRGVNRALCTLPVDALLHFNAAAATLQKGTERRKILHRDTVECTSTGREGTICPQIFVYTYFLLLHYHYSSKPIPPLPHPTLLSSTSPSHHLTISPLTPSPPHPYHQPYPYLPNTISHQVVDRQTKRADTT